jgi:hypothetical protein
MRSDDADGRVLLVVDYPGRRPEAHLSDLGLEAGGWDVRYLVNPPLFRHLDAAGYAAALVDRHAPPAGAAAILAYCTGGAIAQELAAMLGRSGRPLPMILFDGAPSRPALIARDFHVATAEVSGTVAGHEPAGHDDLLSVEALTGGREASFTAMRHELISSAADVLRADGIDDEEAADVAGQSCAVYLDWLAYLIAGYNTTRPPFDGEVLHLVSRRHLFVEPPPGCDAYDLRRIDASAEDLLRTPETRAQTEKFLGRVTALVEQDGRSGR